MFKGFRERKAKEKMLNDLTPRKEFIKGEMDKAKEVLKSANQNSAEYEDHKKIYESWSSQYDDILKTESELRRKDSERHDGRAKTIIYCLGTILAVVGTAALSVLYACIDNVGSTGREAKNWLKEVWKNRPIFK